MIKCKLDSCKYESKENLYCGYHQVYFWKEEQEKDGISKVCNNFTRGCRVILAKNYKFARCDNCREVERTKDKRIRIRKYVDYNKKNYIGKYCIGKNRNNELCNKKCEEKYCKIHEYFKDYTEYMMNNLSKCSGCLNMKYLPNGGVCDICKDRSKKSREKIKVEEKFKICKFIDSENNSCIYKEESELKNGYCGKHQTYYWKEIQEKDGNNKVCCNFIRGCRNVFDINEGFSKCLDCRVKEREKDKARHNIKKEKREENNKKIKVKVKKERNFDDKMICSCKRPNLTLIDFLEDEKDIESEIYKTCKICREKDLLRESKEDRKLYKQELENTPTLKLSRYKKGARIRNLSFDLEKEEFDKLIQEKCYYCGEKEDLLLNGIDRVDSCVGYKENNCVSCCRYCNYLKNKLSLDDFFGKIKHIVSNLGYSNYKYPELFKDHKSSDYNNYKKSANIRSIEFNINEEQFNKIKFLDCYLCNKSVSDKHNNGIDRIDSLKNYDLDNILPCCGDCNIMKNDFILENMLLKFVKIFINNFDKDKLIIKDNESEINLKIEYFIKLKKNQIIYNNKNVEDNNDKILDFEEIKKIKDISTKYFNITDNDLKNTHSIIEEKLLEIKKSRQENRNKYENKIKNKLGEDEYRRMMNIKKKYQRALQRGEIELYNKLLKEYKDILNKLKD